MLLVLFAGAVAPGQTTSPATESSGEFSPGPLQVHVTAVQGGAQYRPAGETKWHAAKTDLDLTEGVEFRTGPKGTIQFTVGTDQIYRVDRLTVVKVVRASLLPNGIIKTDVGMTYGRVSKDVDQPDRPHLDTIIAPSSTLAVRGTRVSLYDQPPYEPEAVSLTGTAIANFHTLSRGVLFGAKGAGTVKITSSNPDPAGYQAKNAEVDPLGQDSGRTGQESQLLTELGGLSGTDLGVFAPLLSAAGNTKETIFGSLPSPGEIFFEIVWSGTPDAQVDYTVKSPLGGSVNSVHTSAPGGGAFGQGSITANSEGSGEQVIDWFTAGAKAGYPAGTYTITQTLLGTTTQTLKQNPEIAVSAFQITTLIAQTSDGPETIVTPPSTASLSAADPTAQYTIKVPFAQGTMNTPVPVRTRH